MGSKTLALLPCCIAAGISPKSTKGIKTFRFLTAQKYKNWEDNK